MLGQSTIAATALAAAWAIVGAKAEGSIDNSEAMKEIQQKAVSFDGTYKITSESTGNTLVYTHTDQPNIFPTSDPLETLLKKIEDLFDNASGEDTFTLIPSKHDNAVMIANTESKKALAAQWNNQTNEDGYGVPYAYEGENIHSDVTASKQWWYFVPCSSSGSSSSSSSGSSSHSSSHHSHGKSTSSKGHKSHGSKKGHSHSKRGHLEVVEKRRLNEEAADVEKRGGSGKDGDYCIVAKDHIQDMKTKAVAAKAADAFAGAKSTLLDYYDESVAEQVWKVTSA